MTTTVAVTEESAAAERKAAHPFVSLSRAAFKGFIRDKTTLFFTILFPLMFLVILGLLFGDAGSAKTKIGAVGEGPIITALAESGAVELVKVAGTAEAEEQVRAETCPRTSPRPVTMSPFAMPRAIRTVRGPFKASSSAS